MFHPSGWCGYYPVCAMYCENSSAFPLMPGSSGRGWDGLAVPSELLFPDISNCNNPPAQQWYKAWMWKQTKFHFPPTVLQGTLQREGDKSHKVHEVPKYEVSGTKVQGHNQNLAFGCVDHTGLKQLQGCLISKFRWKFPLQDQVC